MSFLNAVTSTFSYFPFVSKPRTGVFDDAKIDQTMQLAIRALDEDRRGDADLALDLYFEALNCMFDALPQTRYSKLNKLIDHKFSTLLVRKFDSINSTSRPHHSRSFSEPQVNFQDTSYFDGFRPDVTSGTSPRRNSSNLSDKVVEVAVAGAVALKQSPIPDAFFYLMGLAIRLAQFITEYFGLRELCWNVSKVGVTKAMELDAQYNLHEKASAAMMTSVAAIIKAGIAYKETPSYRDRNQRPY